MNGAVERSDIRVGCNATFELPEYGQTNFSLKNAISKRFLRSDFFNDSAGLISSLAIFRVRDSESPDLRRNVKRETPLNLKGQNRQSKKTQARSCNAV